jgi:MFS transporter, ACS family, hexuronate transporter
LQATDGARPFPFRFARGRLRTSPEPSGKHLEWTRCLPLFIGVRGVGQPNVGFLAPSNRFDTIESPRYLVNRIFLMGVNESVPSVHRVEMESSDAAADSGVGRFRWVICALLFLGISKNYMDRQVLGVLKTSLQHDLGWNEIDYSNLVFAFQAAYTAGMVVMGPFIDRVGTRIGYGAAIVFWSFAAMAHAACNSVLSFTLVRAALGLGESASFPASIKTVTEWFPQKERALATGLFNAGSNVGAILTPLIVPWIAIHLGWRSAFLIVGAAGFAWFLLWTVVYRPPEEHVRCSSRELAYIRSDNDRGSRKVRWATLLGFRQTWAFLIAKFLTDPIWWFYLFWLPGFLQREHDLNLAQIGLPLVVIYVISDAGSIGGGWFSSWLIRAGFSVNAARKTAMLVCAACVVPIISVYSGRGLWPTVAVIGLAAAAHQGFSANLFTTASDMFSREAIASVVGIGGMAGGIGGMLIAKVVGNVLQATGSYLIPFLIAGSSYLVAMLAIQLLAPRLDRVEDLHASEATA